MKRDKYGKRSGTKAAELNTKNAQPVRTDGGSADNVQSTLAIEYSDDHAEDADVSVKITTHADDLEWTVTSDEWDEGITGQVIEDWGIIRISPINIRDKTGKGTTATLADYKPGSGRIKLEEPRFLKYDGKPVNAIIGDVIDNTLGALVKTARKEDRAAKDAKSVAQSNVDVPQIDLVVREDISLFASLNTDPTIVPQDVLVVEPVVESDAYDHWHDAIVETTNRRQVWTSIQHKDTIKLLAPPKYEAGNHLTLAELLDAWDTIDPETVADVVVCPNTVTDSITNLSIGDIVEIEEMPDQDHETKTGVVSHINFTTEDSETRVRIKWDKHTYSVLKEAGSHFQLSLATGGDIRKIKGARVIEALSEADNELLEIRKSTLDLAAFDERVDEVDLEIIGKGSWSDGRDKRGYLLMDGNFVDTIVQVDVANIFDEGWTATIPDVIGIDDETEDILIRVARRNSPITAAIRGPSDNKVNE